MPKLRKSQNKAKKNQTRNVEDYAFKSIIISAILSGLCLTISLFFNGELISIAFTDNVIWQLIEILIRVFSILFFFLFMIVIIGNYKELTGKPITWKTLTLIFILSIIQSILDLKVFIITLIGLILIIVYLYLTQ
jgi:hypothetical protein